jgi:hypothetical protein
LLHFGQNNNPSHSFLHLIFTKSCFISNQQFLIMIKNHLLLLIAATLLISGNAIAQRVCGTNEVLARQLLEDPSLKDKMAEIERQTQQFVQSGGAHDRVAVTIPVVVHVVYNTSTQNISDAQIQSQLTVLNADYRKLNADVANTPSPFQQYTADCEVNFCLATQTPSGTATTGVERRQTTTTSFSTNDNVKHYNTGGLDAWDASKYLNLWVCNLSGGVLGYAQFPGGTPATDGVVIAYTAFGNTGTAQAPYNLGRTATHEVGHWLNLYHIWGDDNGACNGSDQVTDTPNQGAENYGCPAFPHVSCSNGPNGDMFMNYMDYTDDACMYMFTQGQKTRQQSLFASGGARYSLLSSPGCNAPTGGSCGTPANLNATAITQTTATLNWGATSGANTYNLQWKPTNGSTWTTVSNLTGTSYNLSGLTANTSYDFKVQAVCTSGSGTYSAAATFNTLPSGNCADQYEPNNTRTTAKVIPVNTNITAQIASATDLDWNQFSNTTATPNIKVDLTTLPADYDLKLYRGNTLLATSQNGNTTNEQIKYNTSTVSTTYYAYVYGYQNAYSNTQCYTLRVSLSASAWRTDGSTDGQTEEMELAVAFENAGFGMYPNPANDHLTLEIPMESEQAVTATIFDLSGKIAQTQTRSLAKADNIMNFDLNLMPNGIYFVQVRNGENIHTRKLVVNK